MQRRFPTLGRNAKHWVALLAAAAAVVALFWLSASLDELRLAPGQIFSLPERQGSPQTGVTLALPLLFYQVVLGLLAFLLVVSIILVIRSPEDRKALLKRVGLLLLILIVVVLTIRRSSPPLEITPTPTPLPAVGEMAPLPPEAPPASTDVVSIAVTPPSPPQWLKYGVTVVILLGIAAFIFWAWQLLWAPRPPIHDIARSALDELAAGREWEDVVIRCYADMSAAISRRRGLTRAEAMTPREFAQRLERAGLPGVQVSRLTRLFEQARYGSHKSDPAQAQEATACLTAIIQAVEPSP